MRGDRMRTVFHDRGQWTPSIKYNSRGLTHYLISAWVQMIDVRKLRRHSAAPTGNNSYWSPRGSAQMRKLRFLTGNVGNYEKPGIASRRIRPKEVGLAIIKFAQCQHALVGSVLDTIFYTVLVLTYTSSSSTYTYHFFYTGWMAVQVNTFIGRRRLIV